MNLVRKIAALAFLLGFSTYGLPIFAQSSATIAQTVGQRNTIGSLAGTPTNNVQVDGTVTFNYILHTAGAPAPTAETVQFLDGGTAFGTPQAITLAPASNLIPYSQVNTANGWTVTGTSPTVSVGAANGPDGSINTASSIVFPNGTSTILYGVSGSGSYANQQVTFSIWAQSAVATNLTLTVKDDPIVAASSSNVCALTAGFQRCSVTYQFPANAGTGFSVSLSASSPQPVVVWGAQFEAGGQPGPYVSTIGTARPIGAQAGTLAFSWKQFAPGSHTITVNYGGDANYIASVSNAITFNVGKSMPLMTFTDSPASTSIYGQAVTLTAVLTDQDKDPDWIPTGAVQFFDGSTLLGTATIDASGSASVTLTGVTALNVGTHPLTAVYSGDDDFSVFTSPVINHMITKVTGAETTTVTSSLNPSVYGDTVTLSITVASTIGVTPTGTVAVTDGGVALTGSPVTLDGSGHATITVPLFTAGTHRIVVTYSGDNNYN
jgi:hypothetical protein